MAMPTPLGDVLDHVGDTVTPIHRLTTDSTENSVRKNPDQFFRTEEGLKHSVLSEIISFTWQGSWKPLLLRFWVSWNSEDISLLCSNMLPTLFPQTPLLGQLHSFLYLGSGPQNCSEGAFRTHTHTWLYPWDGYEQGI